MKNPEWLDRLIGLIKSYQCQYSRIVGSRVSGNPHTLDAR